jgi:hypothetical protein
MGACVRIFYPKGGQVLAMFKHMPARDGMPAGLYQMFEPWARVVEDVAGPEDIWVKATEEYLLLQKAPKEAWPIRVAARRAELLARKEDIAAQAMAEDLLDYLVEAQGQPRPEPQVRWGFVNMPGVAAAFVGKRGGGVGVAFQCVEKARRVEVNYHSTQPAELALLLDGRSFPVEGEAAAKKGEDTFISGTLELTPELIGALRATSREAGVAIDGATALVAQPRETLQRFADQCELLEAG